MDALGKFFVELAREHGFKGLGALVVGIMVWRAWNSFDNWVAARKSKK